MALYGRQSDKLFEQFVVARADNDLDEVRSVLDQLDSLPYNEQIEMSELREEIDEFLSEFENEDEFEYA